MKRMAAVATTQEPAATAAIRFMQYSLGPQIRLSVGATAGYAGTARIGQGFERKGPLGQWIFAVF